MSSEWFMHNVSKRSQILILFPQICTTCSCSQELGKTKYILANLDNCGNRILFLCIYPLLNYVNPLSDLSFSKLHRQSKCWCSCHFFKISVELGWVPIKVIYPKYSKHWPYTVASTIDCGCSKMLDHGLNHGFFLSLFKLIPCPIHWIVYALCLPKFHIWILKQF